MKRTILTFAILTVLPFSLIAQTNDVVIAQAKEAIEKNDYVSAMSSLKVIFKRSPNNEAALTQRSRIYARQQKFAEATADVTKVLAKNPNNYEALNVRGVIKLTSGKDFVGALADFTKASELRPDFYLAVINIGLTNRMLKKPNDALNAFNKAIELDPNNLQGYVHRGSFFIWVGKYKEAIPDLDKAISLDDRNDDNYAWRAFCQFQLYIDGSKPNRDLAKSDAEKSILLNPNNTLGLGIRSLFRAEDRDIAGTNADADKALQLDPNSYLSYMAKGFVKKRSDGTNDNDGALDEFDKAYKIAPNNSWVRDKRGEAARYASSPLAKQILEEQKKESSVLAKARVETSKQKVAANPWDINAYIDLSEAFKSAESTETKAYWEGWVAKNPRNFCAILFLGDQLDNNQIQFLTDGLKLYDARSGFECAAHLALGIGLLYYDKKDYVSARKYFYKAKEIKPDIPRLKSYLGWNDRRLQEAGWQDPSTKGSKTEASPEDKDRMSDEEFAAFLEVSKGLKSLREHGTEWTALANNWNENSNARSRKLLLAMKSNSENMLSIAEKLLAKYPNKLEAGDAKYLNETIIRKRSDIARIEKSLEKYPE